LITKTALSTDAQSEKFDSAYFHLVIASLKFMILAGDTYVALRKQFEFDCQYFKSKLMAHSIAL